MTTDEAILVARNEADLRGYVWIEPVKCTIRRRWILWGRRSLTVLSNANARGMNVTAEFDQESGALLSIGYCPR
jgi:hypothetical protein